VIQYRDVVLHRANNSVIGDSLASRFSSNLVNRSYSASVLPRGRRERRGGAGLDESIEKNDYVQNGYIREETAPQDAHNQSSPYGGHHGTPRQSEVGVAPATRS